MRNSHGPDNPDTSRGYEVEDASVREVLWTGLGLAVGTVVVCLGVFGLLRVLQQAEARGRQPITEMSAPLSAPPEPRLQERPWEEMEAFRQREDRLLGTYGWADQAAGRVRLPIDQAMELVLQRGLPARDPGEQTAAAGAGAGQSAPARPGGNQKKGLGEGNAPARQ